MEWYNAMCSKWNMDQHVWDIEQFRYNEKQVTGNYDFILEIVAAGYEDDFGKIR